jgi:hypothetical protein
VDSVPLEEWEGFQSQVKVFWIEVQPIWNTTQELMDWSRIGNRELSCRNILVHEITMIVKVHFTIFIAAAVTGRRTWKTWSCVGTLHHISVSISCTISYTISYTILRTQQKDPLWLLDIDTISKKIRRYRLRFSNSTLFGTRYWYDVEVFFRNRVRYRTAISGYTDIKGKNFDVVKDIGAISGYTDIKVFPSISKIWSILGTICHTWGGRAHRPRSSPGLADGSSLLVFDPLGRSESVLLRDCLDALSCWSSTAAFCFCSGQALVWIAGWSRWAVLISSYRSTSDLVMIQMMSVKYAFTLSLVSCLRSASDASVFAGPGAEPAGPAATD